MKKLFYVFSIMLVVACGSDDPVTPPTVNTVFVLNATGTVAEKSPEEAKKIIYGKWGVLSTQRLTAGTCTFNSVEFTDDDYILNFVINGEPLAIFGDFEVNVDDTTEFVTSIDLNFFYGTSNVTIATLTDIVTVEDAGIINTTFSVEWSIPEAPDFNVCDNLQGNYSAVKDEPMEESNTADPNSNHAKIVGNWTFVSKYENDEDKSLDWLNDPCLDEYDNIIENCSGATGLSLTLSTFGTYALVWTGSSEGIYVESDTWSWTDDAQTAFTVGSDPDDNTLITIESLTSTQAVFNEIEIDEYYPDNVYDIDYTFKKN